MYCPECGTNNDADAKFCVNCGANLRSTLSSRVDTVNGMSASVKILIIAVIVLVLGIGLVSGMLIMQNQANPATNISVNDSTGDVSQSKPANQNPQYKTFSNSVIYFQYPSSWDVLPNNANSMVLVGLSNNPSFSVYDESKYRFTSLSDSVSESKKARTKEGNTIISERSLTVDGYPAYEIIYQWENLYQQIVLVEKSPGSKYYALVGVDSQTNFDKSSPIFNQIVNSFKFTS